jgi:hypothetical protein
MSRDDYEAIAKIIEDVVGEDTIAAVKLLEGVKFYFDNKVNTVRIVKDETPFFNIKRNRQNSPFYNDREISMEKFTKKLSKENAKFKSKKKNCSENS